MKVNKKSGRERMTKWIHGNVVGIKHEVCGMQDLWFMQGGSVKRLVRGVKWLRRWYQVLAM